MVADLEGRRGAAYAADWRPRFADAYRLQLQAWVDAVAAGRPAPLATAADGLAATVVADAVIASMRAGGSARRGRRRVSGASFPATLPAPRTPPSDAAPPLRWGLLGTGWIAERFAGSLQRHTRQRVHAIGSRDLGRSRAFAAACGAPRAYGSYEELVADADVDVVYVATPHPAHHPCALLSLGAGKHTLVEKPLALNAAQAAEIAELAARRGVFCMEALWTLFLPKFDVVRQLLEAGVLGPVRTVQADCGEYFDRRAPDPARRPRRRPAARSRHLPRVLRDLGPRAARPRPGRRPAASRRRQRAGRGDPHRRRRQPGRRPHDAVQRHAHDRDDRRDAGRRSPSTGPSTSPAASSCAPPAASTR